MHSAVQHYYRERHQKCQTFGDVLKIPIMFDPNATTPFSQAMSGITIVPKWHIGKTYKRHQAEAEKEQHWHEYTDCARNVQIFFCWSIHTVYSTRVSRVNDTLTCCMVETKEGSTNGKYTETVHRDVDFCEDARYIGIIDYRVLMNWIVSSQSKEISRWLIAC